jgi:N-acetylmuramoyl-L-alanine amidase
MTKKKQLSWVYPQNNWVSNFNKTFVYGWCNPKAKLFVSVLGEAGLKPACTKPASPKEIKIFPNGNFAQTIKLPHKKNVIKLIQILNGKKKIISRPIIAKKSKKLKNVIPNLIGNPGAMVLDSRFCRNDISKNMIIIIDPGHGGKEHGTHSPKGIPEKHFNLQIAKLLFKTLRREWSRPFPT